MDILGRTFGNIFNTYSNSAVDTSKILSVLIMALILSFFEFAVYRLVSHRAFYNKSFNICIVIIPFFVATIILCLQSNIVITLGTIGALAILRFRTAVKDPVDMLYLLWSVHIGIVCGCQLYEVALLTSLAVTIVLILMNYASAGRKPLVLVFQCNYGEEQEIVKSIGKITPKYKIKSRNYTSDMVNFVIELSIKDTQPLMEELKKHNVQKFSVIEYDSEDVI